jgi:hypothetical protein
MAVAFAFRCCFSPFNPQSEIRNPQLVRRRTGDG